MMAVLCNCKYKFRSRLFHTVYHLAPFSAALRTQLANYVQTGSIGVTITNSLMQDSLSVPTAFTIAGWTTSPPDVPVSILVDQNTFTNGLLVLSGVFPPSTTISITNNNMNMSLPVSNRVIALSVTGVSLSGSGSSFLISNNQMFSKDAQEPVSQYLRYVHAICGRFRRRELYHLLNNITASSSQKLVIGMEFLGGADGQSLRALDGGSVNIIYNQVTVSTTGTGAATGVSFKKGIASNSGGTSSNIPSKFYIQHNTFKISATSAAATGIVSTGNAGVVTPAGFQVFGTGTLKLMFNTYTISSAAAFSSIGINFSPDVVSIGPSGVFQISSETMSVSSLSTARGVFFAAIWNQWDSRHNVVDVSFRDLTGSTATYESSGICFRTSDVTVDTSGVY